MFQIVLWYLVYRRMRASRADLTSTGLQDIVLVDRTK